MTDRAIEDLFEQYLEKKRQAALIEITKHFQLKCSSQQSLGNPEDFDNEFSPVKKRKTF